MSTQLDIKFLKSFIRRRKNIFLCTFLTIFISVFAFALYLPPIYRSEAIISIQNQQIPEEFVKSTFTTYIEEHLAKLTRQIINRSKLLKIIEQYNLFQENQTYDTKHDFVEQIQNSLKVEPISTQVLNQRTGRATAVTTSFRLIYDAKDPYTAQKVTNVLAQLFLEEDVQTKAKRASVTTNFFQEELAKLEKQINLYDSQISEFKARHTDDLPEHQHLILQAVQRLERELENLDTRIVNLQDNIIFLQGQIADVDPLNPIVTEDGKIASNPRERLRNMQLQLIRRQATVSPKHPDIKRLKREIKELEAQLGKTDNSAAKIKRLKELENQLAAEKSRLGSKHPDVIKLSKEVKALASEVDTLLSKKAMVEITREKPDNPAYISLMTRIASAQMTLNTYLQDKKNIKQELEEYHKKVQNAPSVEREYNGLVRDYQTVKNKYHQTLEKLLEARMTQNLEKKTRRGDTGGKRFIILSEAYLPEKPYKPNRRAIIILGFVLAIGTGLFISAARESTDNSIKTPEELHKILDFPVLSTISLIVTDQERRRRRLKTLIASLSAIVIILFAFFLIDRYITPLDIVWTKVQDRISMMGIPISPSSLDNDKLNQTQKSL